MPPQQKILELTLPLYINSLISLTENLLRFFVAILLEVDTVQQRQNNAALQHQLDQLRQLVVTQFKNIQIPGFQESLNLVSADQFVSTLHSLLEQPGHAQSPLANSVRDIISSLDFSQIVA